MEITSVRCREALAHASRRDDHQWVVWEQADGEGGQAGIIALMKPAPDIFRYSRCYASGHSKLRDRSNNAEDQKTDKQM